MEWHLDTDLLGLQHELLAHLSDRGIVWFEDFSRIEADLGNAELKIYLTCPFERSLTVSFSAGSTKLLMRRNGSRARSRPARTSRR